MIILINLFRIKSMKYLILFMLLVTFIGCEVQSPPKVIVTSKISGFDANIYYDIELKNVGEQPAYFVLLIATALNSANQPIQTIEKSYGDLFPDESLSQRVSFNKVFSQPDSIAIEIAYQLTMDKGY